MALARLDRHAEALRCLERASELEPQSPAIWNNKGEVLGQLNRWQEAVPCFDRALAVGPSFAPAWFGKARALFNLDRKRECAVACERFLKLARPDDPLIAPTRQMLKSCWPGGK